MKMAMSPRLKELYEKKRREIAPFFAETVNFRRFPKHNSTMLPVKTQQSISSLGKLHQVSDIISHYYISPAKELVYDKESFNAAITFTILTSILQNSSIIYFGSTGSGKTTLAEFISSAIFDIPLRQIQQATIYGHPE